MNFFRTAAIGSVLTFLAVPTAYLIRLGYARGLSVTEFGLIYAIISLFTFLGLFATLGVSPSLAHLIPKHERQDQTNRIIAAASIVRTIGTIATGAAVFIIAPLLETSFFRIEGASLALRIMTFYFVTHHLTGLAVGVFQGYRRTWAYAGYNFYRQFLVFLVSIGVAAVFELTVVNVAITWAATHAFTSIIYYILMRTSFPAIRWETPDRSAYNELLSYAIPTILVGGAGLVMAQIDTIMVTALRSLEEVAAYNVAYPTASLLLLLATPIVMTILPEVSHLYHKKRTANAQNLVETITRVMTAASLFGAILLSTLAYPLLILLFDVELAAAWPALAILAFGLAASGLANINLQTLGAIGKVGRRATIMNVAVGINVALNVALIYLYGYVGAAIATTITYVILLVLSVLELNRHGFSTIETSMLWRLGIPAIAAATVTIGIAQFTSGPIVTIIAAGGVGSIVYAGIALLTKGIRIDDLMMLWKEARALIPR